MNIGLLHPGEMGSAVGRCLTGAGHSVLWASAGRGDATAARARAADLTDAGTAAGVVSESDVILSICPPHAALDVARSVAGFPGIFVDANAVSPGTARQAEAIVAAGGGTFVDGGIVGPPPAEPGHTRLYLSGERACSVADVFAGTAVDARVVAGGAGAASAVKMSYAAWTKGSGALLLAIRAMARAEGVEDTLLAEWALSQPSLAARSEQAARSAAAKGWRWIAEMEEIAAAMAADDLPQGFGQAAADIYRRAAAEGHRSEPRLFRGGTTIPYDNNNDGGSRSIRRGRVGAFVVLAHLSHTSRKRASGRSRMRKIRVLWKKRRRKPAPFLP